MASRIMTSSVKDGRSGSTDSGITVSYVRAMRGGRSRGVARCGGALARSASIGAARAAVSRITAPDSPAASWRSLVSSRSKLASGRLRSVGFRATGFALPGIWTGTVTEVSRTGPVAAAGSPMPPLERGPAADAGACVPRFARSAASAPRARVSVSALARRRAGSVGAGPSEASDQAAGPVPAARPAAPVSARAAPSLRAPIESSARAKPAPEDSLRPRPSPRIAISPLPGPAPAVAAPPPAPAPPARGSPPGAFAVPPPAEEAAPDGDSDRGVAPGSRVPADGPAPSLLPDRRTDPAPLAGDLPASSEAEPEPPLPLNDPRPPKSPPDGAAPPPEPTAVPPMPASMLTNPPPPLSGCWFLSGFLSSVSGLVPGCPGFCAACVPGLLPQPGVAGLPGVAPPGPGVAGLGPHPGVALLAVAPGWPVPAAGWPPP